MLRKTKLGGTLGELAIIVVGVIIALGFDSWSHRRGEADELQDYLARLITDLEADSATFTLVLEVLDRKEAALDAVAEVALGSRPATRDSSFFDALTATTFMGFHTPGTQRATFDDMVATGNMRLIQDPDMRAALVGYYQETDRKWLRIDRRRTGYPQAAYRLSPRDWPGGSLEDLQRQSLDSVQTPGFVNLMNAESVLSAFQRRMMQDSMLLVADLLAQVRAARVGQESV